MAPKSTEKQLSSRVRVATGMTYMHEQTPEAVGRPLEQSGKQTADESAKTARIRIRKTKLSNFYNFAVTKLS